MNAPLTSSASAPRLAPDLALPQRDLLLDDQQMAARLSLLITPDGPSVVASCEKQRIKYRIGESLRILYRLYVNGRPHLIAAKAFAEPYAETAAGAAAIFENSRQVFDRDLRTSFWVYPNDRKIAHLNLLRDSPETLSRVLGGNWQHSEAIAYVPEKCATVRCLDGDGQAIAYAKMYASTEGRGIHRAYLQLASACARVVKPLEYSEPSRLLLLNAVPGTRIADLKHDELNDGFAGLAQTLASLHSAPVPRQLPRFHRHDLDRLRKCVRIVGRARPDVARVANQLDDDLRSTVPPAEPLVCLHGDVHPKNGISNGGVTLIDLDQSAIGPAAADLGSMLALLHYNRRTGLITRRTEQQLASAFLGAYAASRHLPTQRTLNWYTAAALLSERALRSVNRIRRAGLQHLSLLLNDAREILRTGGANS